MLKIYTLIFFQVRYYILLSGIIKVGIKKMIIFYRLQTKFAKVMFLHLSVSHSVHGGGRWYPSMQWANSI